MLADMHGVMLALAVGCSAAADRGGRAGGPVARADRVDAPSAPAAHGTGPPLTRRALLRCRLGAPGQPQPLIRHWAAAGPTGGRTAVRRLPALYRCAALVAPFMREFRCPRPVCQSRMAVGWTSCPAEGCPPERRLPNHRRRHRHLTRIAIAAWRPGESPWRPTGEGISATAEGDGYRADHEEEAGHFKVDPACQDSSLGR